MYEAEGIVENESGTIDPDPTVFYHGRIAEIAEVVAFEKGNFEDEDGQAKLAKILHYEE